MGALADDPYPGWTVYQIDVEYIHQPAQYLTELTAALLQKEHFRRFIHKAKGVPSSLHAWISKTLETISFEVAGTGEVKLSLRDNLLKPAQWPELTEQLFAVLESMDGDVLLIVDEFPVMVGTFLDESEADALSFLKWFRAQRQRADRSHVRLLLGGSVNIEPRLEAIGRQALLNDLQRFRLEQMSVERSVDFVRRVLEGERAKFEAGVPEEIVRVAECGIHFFLQVLISECLTEARRTAEMVRKESISAIYRERVLGPANRTRFSHYSSRLKEHYGRLESAARTILSTLARREKASEADLASDLRNIGESPHDLPRLLTLLESDYYIVRDGGRVSFSSGFLRDWWTRNVPFPSRVP